jgi:hypothetical protein
VSASTEWDTWWDGASDEERQEFLDGCVDLDDAIPARHIHDVIRDLADYQP